MLDAVNTTVNRQGVNNLVIKKKKKPCLYSACSSQVMQWQRIYMPMQETQVQSLGGKDLLEKGMATHSSILVRNIPWTEEPHGLQSMGSQRVRHD